MCYIFSLSHATSWLSCHSPIIHASAQRIRRPISRIHCGILLHRGPIFWSRSRFLVAFCFCAKYCHQIRLAYFFKSCNRWSISRLDRGILQSLSNSKYKSTKSTYLFFSSFSLECLTCWTGGWVGGSLIWYSSRPKFRHLPVVLGYCFIQHLSRGL